MLNSDAIPTRACRNHRMRLAGASSLLRGWLQLATPLSTIHDSLILYDFARLNRKSHHYDLSHFYHSQCFHPHLLLP